MENVWITLFVHWIKTVTKVENELYIILMQKLYIWVYIHDVLYEFLRESRWNRGCYTYRYELWPGREMCLIITRMTYFASTNK